MLPDLPSHASNNLHIWGVGTITRTPELLPPCDVAVPTFSTTLTPGCAPFFESLLQCCDASVDIALTYNKQFRGKSIRWEARLPAWREAAGHESGQRRDVDALEEPFIRFEIVEVNGARSWLMFNPFLEEFQDWLGSPDVA